MYTIDKNKLYVFKLEKCDLLLHRLAEKNVQKSREKNWEKETFGQIHRQHIYKKQKEKYK